MGLPADEKVIEKYAEGEAPAALSAEVNELVETALDAAVVTAKAAVEGNITTLVGQDLLDLAKAYLLVVSLLNDVAKTQAEQLAAIPAAGSV